MDHRRTTAGKALTLPGWVIIGSALVCLAAAILLGTLVIGGRSSDTASSKPTAPATTASPATPSATPTTAAPTTTAPSSEPTEPATSPAPAEAARTIAVSVFNQTRTAGLARSVAAKVTAAGWRVNGTGNWHGAVPQTTVYYPPGFQQQADQLAKDLDFERVRPLVAPMRSDRLTLVLADRQ